MDKTTIRKRIADALHEKRHAGQWSPGDGYPEISLREASAGCGVSFANIGRIESGLVAPNIFTLLLICRWTGKSPNELLGWEEQATP